VEQTQAILGWYQPIVDRLPKWTLLPRAHES
jgi:hypothetical protein